MSEPYNRSDDVRVLHVDFYARASSPNRGKFPPLVGWGCWVTLIGGETGRKELPSADSTAATTRSLLHLFRARHM